MKERKYFNKDYKNIKSNIAIGRVLMIGFTIIALAAVLIMNEKKLVFTGVLLIILEIAQVVWMIWMQIKNVKPIEKIAGIIETTEFKNYEEINEQMQQPQLGYVGMLIRRLATVINGESTAMMLSTQASLFVLQSEINPHFLYNTLETIRSQAIKKDVQEIAEMTEALATLFRYSISRPNEITTLADEIDNVKNYLMIQSYRFPDRFEIRWIIDEEDREVMDCSLPILIIQPLVENAIHHGLGHKMGNILIIIRVIDTRKKLSIEVIDNGEGIPEEKLIKIKKSLNKPLDYFTDASLRMGKSRHGIALNNVNQRIKLLYGQEYGLNISSTVGVGTTMEVIVPKNKWADNKMREE